MVGAGIIGTWHALELLAAGFSVDHLDADAAPVGASVRNFGLVWVSGRRSGTSWRSPAAPGPVGKKWARWSPTSDSGRRAR